MQKIVLFLFLFSVISVNIFAGTLVVLNKDDSNLAIVDTETIKVVAKIPTGNSTHFKFIKHFTANYFSQTILF